MNKEIKKRWVEALRSGKYIQGQNYLLSNDTYCCLGVLCDLYVKEHNICWEELTATDTQQNKVPPPEAVEWAEMHLVVPRVLLSDLRREVSLTELNDNLHYSFDQIAGLIEEQL